MLSLISAANWTLVPITFGTSAPTPVIINVGTSMGAGATNYSYVMTSVDVNGQESAASTPGVLANTENMQTIAGTNFVNYSAVPGAVSYNFYKATSTFGFPVQAGAAFGYIGNATGVSFADTNIAPDFSIGPPVAQNPFQGAGVDTVTLTVNDNYTIVPSVTFTAAPSGGVTATGYCYLNVASIAMILGSGTGGHFVGEVIHFANGVAGVVATIDGGGEILTFQPIGYPGTNGGYILSGAVPANPVLSTDINVIQANLTWHVGAVVMSNNGAGYAAAPTGTFSSGLAAATTTLAEASAGNPSVPGYFQQRLVLAALAQAPQSFFMSQPGSYYNFNITDPIEADNAISGDLVSGQLNTIKSLVPMQAGLIVLSDRTSWLINGGSAGSAVAPDSIVANPQSYIGANDVTPIVANFDILYVQAKGSVIRDNSFNFYSSVFTGTDISVLSSHLFYGYTITGWAWAEEPFKIVWTIRDDGTLLSLTFLKEQELIGWAHSDTDGLFKSVAVVTETVDSGAVDAPYFVVERVINGQTLKYIERMAERIFPNGVEDAWCVDAGLQYNGAPATEFSGGEHLAGATVTGLADGVVIPPFVMAEDGTFTLVTAASKVTVGLAFTPQLQTLALDVGEPTVQGEQKKINKVIARVTDTLGLWTGSDFDNLVAMKDLVRGNVGSQSNEIVTDLFTGDAMTIQDPKYTEAGQYCFEQPYPLPATILGVIPTFTTAGRK